MSAANSELRWVGLLVWRSAIGARSLIAPGRGAVCSSTISVPLWHSQITPVISRKCLRELLTSKSVKTKHGPAKKKHSRVHYLDMEQSGIPEGDLRRSFSRTIDS